MKNLSDFRKTVETDGDAFLQLLSLSNSEVKVWVG